MSQTARPSFFATTSFLFLFLLSGCARKPVDPKPAASQLPPSSTFQNPLLWEDLADLDIIRVGDTYYYSASNMHYSPGAPILRSRDLVHWEYAGHSVPVLDFSPAYDLKGGNAYVKGTWASFLGYRKSNKTFYWGGCIEFSKTYIYTAPAAEGPWQKKAQLNHCYYDAGLLIDDDDTMYVAYGNKTLNVAQLSPDGTREVRSQPVFKTPPAIGTLEGSRFYKVNGAYYIFTDRPPNAEYVLKSTSGPFGPYEMRPLVVEATSPIPGGGSPHQGGIVQTRNGNWYYMGFVDAYPGGRVPVLAPMKWNTEGWPDLELTNNNTWAASYPSPNISGAPSFARLCAKGGNVDCSEPPLRAPLADSFSGKALNPEWEWNHNPDNTKWSLDRGLKLETATVTDDLYSARNTLTHRILGPTSTSTIALDYLGMKDGDRAGLAMLRDSSAWVGIQRDAGSYKVVMQNNLTMDSHWNTASKGTEAASAPISGGKIWLRVSADVRPGPNRTANFSYSTDGKTFQPIGPPFALKTDWRFFMGYRYAIFNYATQTLGGAIRVSTFTMETP